MATTNGFVSSVEQLKSIPTKNGAKSLLEFSIKEPGDFGAWITCTLWGERAEKLASHITPGLFLVVTGDMGSDAWSAKQGGDVKSKVTLSVFSLVFGGYSKSAFQKGLVPINANSGANQNNNQNPNRSAQAAPMGANNQNRAPAHQPSQNQGGYSNPTAGYDDDDVPFSNYELRTLA